MPAKKTMYAFSHRDTGLWWNRLNEPDTDDLCYAALFPTKIAGTKLTPDLEYVPVKLDVTLSEAKEVE